MFGTIIVKIMERKALLLGYDEPAKLLTAVIDGKAGKLRDNKLSQEEITELSKKLLRASNELDTGQKPSKSDKNSGGDERSAALRSDIPPALPDGKDSDIPHGSIKQS